MKLDRLTVMAEIIGAVAIVVTLVILIFEVRGNTEELRAATISNIAGRTQEVNLLKVRNLQFAEVMTRLDAGDELSPAESFQVIDYLLAVLKVAEESFISHRAGSLDEDIWLTRASAAVGHLQDEQSRAMYIRIRDRGSLTPDFTDWLDVTLIERYGKLLLSESRHSESTAWGRPEGPLLAESGPSILEFRWSKSIRFGEKRTLSQKASKPVC